MSGKTTRDFRAPSKVAGKLIALVRKAGGIVELTPKLGLRVIIGDRSTVVGYKLDRGSNWTQAVCKIRRETGLDLRKGA